jgi:hypothetical protein
MMPLISYEEIAKEHGQDVAYRVLGFGWHHFDEAGRPFWATEDYDRAFLIMQLEDNSCEEARDL